MKIIIKQFLFLGLVTTSLCSCNTFFDKDNTPTPAPLVNFTETFTAKPIWNTRVGSGAGKEYLKLTPTLSDQTIFTASSDGTVTATDKETGKKNWAVNVRSPLTGGTALDENKIFVGSRSGKIFALNKDNGNLIWKTQASSEIVAPAAAANHLVLVKSIDGHLTAFSTLDGKPLWHYDQAEPTLILSGASAPTITGNAVIVGFENGNLVKLTLQEGHLIWSATVANPQGIFAIQRMVDIDADPIIVGNRVFATTYQGRMTAFELSSGKELWSHDLSSISGMVSDGKKVYVSDISGQIWAFDIDSGEVYWRQTQLTARNLTGPALFNNTVVVGDAEGYLHWVSKDDGHFLSRSFVNKSGMIATPIAEQNTLYVYTKDGHLAAYTVG